MTDYNNIIIEEFFIHYIMDNIVEGCKTVTCQHSAKHDELVIRCHSLLYTIYTAEFLSVSVIELCLETVTDLVFGSV